MPTEDKPIRPETSPDVGATKRFIDVWTLKNRVIGIDVPSVESSGHGAAKSADNSNIARQRGITHEAEGLADVVQGKDPNEVKGV